MTEENLKSASEMSLWEFELLKVGDPIACDMCGEAGVWDPDLQVGNISQSEFDLDGDLACDAYVCHACEYKRKLLKEEEGEE